MSGVLREFEVQTERRTQVVDVTREVRAATDDASPASAAIVYVPHTTAGVVIQENADPAVGRDLERALERVVEDAWGWEHVEAGEENAPSHVRAALTASSVVVPLRDGDLALGTWQGIFFCEFDGPRRRKVYVTTLS
ncbi:MAG: secondary thiamine-phosphate synthase enzyme YjbQ [Actinomycetota bacterium]|nr:secondary thiamine-phosphate synthase enzyme YjbQ [Actinomycetota bacterium]